MKLRDGILIIGGVALVGAIVSLMALGGGSAAPENGPPSLVGDPVPAGMRGGPIEPAPASSPIVAGTAERQPQHYGMTSGIIHGDIALSPDVVDRISSITVSVQELAGEPAYSRSRKVVMDLGTPTFEFTGIPFSKHGYSVRVFSPGLNGSEQIVGVTAQDPIADAVLGLSPPVPFSVVLVDQFGDRVSDLKVSMLPLELPLGRGPLNGSTDNFGSLLFEEVLAGDYLIHIDTLEKPVRVTVQPPGVVFQPKQLVLRGQQVKHQFASITVPRGKALSISVTGPAGHGLKDAKLTLFATTSVRYQPYEAITDYTGRHVFPHLPAGEYQLNVELAGHQRWTRTIRWKQDEDPPQQDVVLYPRRK